MMAAWLFVGQGARTAGYGRGLALAVAKLLKMPRSQWRGIGSVSKQSLVIGFALPYFFLL